MTLPFEPIPASQLFRALLLHFIETHSVLTPIVRTTLSRELKLCHMQNAYMLSEIESWLSDLPEDTDLTPSLSAAQVAVLRVGVVLSLRKEERPGESPPPSARTAPTELRRGSRRAASSRSAELISQASARTSNGVITFLQQSSSAKPPSTSPTLPETPEDDSREQGLSSD